MAYLDQPRGLHDACFLPRSCHVTGDIRCHEIGWSDDELWLVNTRFSCLCTLHPDYSFVPRWKPPFVTELVPEDRCHLNGLEIVDGQPKFATALGETDQAEGWRERKNDGGCLIDVPSNTVVVRNLCMPHSPRVHDGRVWLLDSGRGSLLFVELATGTTQSVATVPGYARGLAFLGKYAFIGLSKIRESEISGGLPITQEIKELKCGVWVVDISSLQSVAFLEFERSVEESFDVRLWEGIRWPAVIGLQKETVQGTFVVPR